MSRNIDERIGPTLATQALLARRPDLTGEAQSILFDALLRAVRRIQIRWPIDTGRSLLGFGVVRTSIFEYAIRNDSRDNRGQYAGYVFRGGGRRYDALGGGGHNGTSGAAGRAGGVPFEAQEAQEEAETEIAALALARPDPRRRRPLTRTVTPRPSVAGIRASILRRVRTLLAEQIADAAQAGATAAAPGVVP